MTREEAKEIIKIIDKRYCTLYKDERQALEMAIQALSSWETYSDKLWKEAYERGKTEALSQEPILEKIAEIIEPLRHLSFDEMSDVEWQMFQVIDKYAEQEPYICDTCKHKDAEWDTEPCDGCCGNHSGYEPCDDCIFEEVSKYCIDHYCINHCHHEAKAESCEDAISREMALKECHDIVVDGELYRVIQEETLLGLPPITQKLGKWITEEISEGRKVYCSECKESADFEYVRDGDIYSSYGHGVVKKTKYCPNCGAKMESEG